MSAFTPEDLRRQKMMLNQMKSRESVAADSTARRRLLASTPAPILTRDPIATATVAHGEFDRWARADRRDRRFAAITLAALAFSMSGIGYAVICVSEVL